MRALLILLLKIVFSVSVNTKQEPYITPHGSCTNDGNLVEEYRKAFDRFSVDIFQKAAPKAEYYFAMATHSVWITLAAFAEGSDSKTKETLFDFLHLPNDSSIRQKYYRIATTRLNPSTYVNALQNRVLVIDENAVLDQDWYNFVRQHSLLQVVPAPLKRDPELTSQIVKHITSSEFTPDLGGNSVILDSLDFDGMWTVPFENTERAPFYSPSGEKIGYVDLMRARIKARIGFSCDLDAKTIEIPIGANAEYSIIIALIVNNTNMSPALKGLQDFTVAQVVDSLKDSVYTPVEVSIPRFKMTSDINVKEILEDLGIVDLWQDPDATRSISTPSAHPSSYIQRTTLTLDNKGVNASCQHTNPAGTKWEQFTANSPFMFGVFDTDTYTCFMSVAYTQPTYKN